MEDLRTKIYEAIGAASMCWSETPSGVFEDSKAKEIAEKLVVEMTEKEQALPSRFKHGNLVSIKVAGFVVDKAEVIRIHFTRGKVCYDLEVEFILQDSVEVGYTRIYNIDSAFLNAY